MLKRFLNYGLLVIVILGLATGYGVYHLKTWAQKTVRVSDEAIVFFPSGTRLVELSGILEGRGVVSDALKFHAWVRLFEDYGKFQAGNYKFEGLVSPQEVLEKISSGKVHRQIVVQFTIPEGFTSQKIVNRLVAKGLGTRKTFMSLMKDASFLTSLGIKGNSMEGFLYPATYSFHTRPKPREVLEKMVGVFHEKVTSDLIARFSAEGLTLREAVTFASLIELETLHEDEKPKVSEVIWRRLRASEPLGIDAALIYGIKDYRGDITWAHLRDRKNLYNTRVHKGLPPGPVGSPSLSSLKAVLSPTNNGYYYYVLVADGRKRHHFSKTLKEHQKYVRKLKQAQTRR